MCIFVVRKDLYVKKYPPDGLLTLEKTKNEETQHIVSDPFYTDDLNEPLLDCLLSPTVLNIMSAGEDELSSGLQGRLRPRKTTAAPPQRITRKSDTKHTPDRPTGNSTPPKVTPTKSDDLANKSDANLTLIKLCPYCDRKFNSKQNVSKHVRRVHIFPKQDSVTSCLFCNHVESDPNDIIRHMVDNHPNHYFACLDCHSRFSSTSELAEHKLNVCEKQKTSYRSKSRQKNTTKTKKIQKQMNVISKNSYHSSDAAGFNGIVISCELKPAHGRDEADIEDNITTNLILPPSKSLNNSVIEKKAVIILDDIQWTKRIPSNFSFHNTDADQILSRLGVVHKSPRTGEPNKKHWLKVIDEVNQKFERCFDTAFYSRVASNVQENLAKYLDGSFNFNPDPENVIKTRKSKNNVVINTAEGFPILLATEQYTRNVFESYHPRAIAPKHKWKWDSTDNDKITPSSVQIKHDSHTNNCIISLVSSLDIWTQLCMRRKYEEKYNISPTEKIDKQNALSLELKEILESRDIPSTSKVAIKSNSKGIRRDQSEPPAWLQLRRVDSRVSVPPAELSGEWVRPRCYVCCACGEQTPDARAVSTHINANHPNAQIQHYEIVGERLLNSDILKHLYVPPAQINRTRPPRGFRDCTKCNLSVSLEELHQHMLDCAGDTPTVRRKVRPRPFGARRRRLRLPDNAIRQKIRKQLRTRYTQNNRLRRTRPKIRSEVGDAETIRRMIADLPAKRHRVVLNPTNTGRPQRSINEHRNKIIIKRRATEEHKNRRLLSCNEPSSTLINNVIELNDDDDKPLKSTMARMRTRRMEAMKKNKQTILLNRVKRKTANLQNNSENAVEAYGSTNNCQSTDNSIEGNKLQELDIAQGASGIIHSSRDEDGTEHDDCIDENKQQQFMTEQVPPEMARRYGDENRKEHTNDNFKERSRTLESDMPRPRRSRRQHGSRDNDRGERSNDNNTRRNKAQKIKLEHGMSGLHDGSRGENQGNHDDTIYGNKSQERLSGLHDGSRGENRGKHDDTKDENQSQESESEQGSSKTQHESHEEDRENYRDDHCIDGNESQQLKCEPSGTHCDDIIIEEKKSQQLEIGQEQSEKQHDSDDDQGKHSDDNFMAENKSKELENEPGPSGTQHGSPDESKEKSSDGNFIDGSNPQESDTGQEPTGRQHGRYDGNRGDRSNNDSMDGNISQQSGPGQGPSERQDNRDKDQGGGDIGDGNNNNNEKNNGNGGGSGIDPFRNMVLQQAKPPLKHSIASLTENHESQDKAVQFHYSFIKRKGCYNLTHYRHTGHHRRLENETASGNFEKPPITDLMQYNYDQKHRPHKSRKGLNACIAMLRNKLSEPYPYTISDPASLEHTENFKDAIVVSRALEMPEITNNNNDNNVQGQKFINENTLHRPSRNIFGTDSILEQSTLSNDPMMKHMLHVSVNEDRYSEARYPYLSPESNLRTRPAISPALTPMLAIDQRISENPPSVLETSNNKVKLRTTKTAKATFSYIASATNSMNTFNAVNTRYKHTTTTTRGGKKMTQSKKSSVSSKNIYQQFKEIESHGTTADEYNLRITEHYKRLYKNSSRALYPTINLNAGHINDSAQQRNILGDETIRQTEVENRHHMYLESTLLHNRYIGNFTESSNEIGTTKRMNSFPHIGNLQVNQNEFTNYGVVTNGKEKIVDEMEIINVINNTGPYNKSNQEINPRQTMNIVQSDYHNLQLRKNKHEYEVHDSIRHYNYNSGIGEHYREIMRSRRLSVLEQKEKISESQTENTHDVESNSTPVIYNNMLFSQMQPAHSVTVSAEIIFPAPLDLSNKTQVLDVSEIQNEDLSKNEDSQTSSVLQNISQRKRQTDIVDLRLKAAKEDEPSSPPPDNNEKSEPLVENTPVPASESHEKCELQKSPPTPDIPPSSVTDEELISNDVNQEKNDIECPPLAENVEPPSNTSKELDIAIKPNTDDNSVIDISENQPPKTYVPGEYHVSQNSMSGGLMSLFVQADIEIRDPNENSDNNENIETPNNLKCLKSSADDEENSSDCPLTNSKEPSVQESNDQRDMSCVPVSTSPLPHVTTQTSDSTISSHDALMGVSTSNDPSPVRETTPNVPDLTGIETTSITSPIHKADDTTYSVDTEKLKSVSYVEPTSTVNTALETSAEPSKADSPSTTLTHILPSIGDSNSNELSIIKDSNHLLSEITEEKTITDSSKDKEYHIDQDLETAKKIALLPKELVEIIGTIPPDHRNQLLNVLPQYVTNASSTSKGVESNIETPSFSVLDTAISSALTLNETKELSLKQTKDLYHPLNFQEVYKASSVIAHLNRTPEKSIANQHVVCVEDNKQENMFYLKSPVEQENGSSTTKKIENPSQYISNMETIGTADVRNEQVLIPALNFKKSKSNNEQTASLRAVRIKTASERHKTKPESVEIPKNSVTQRCANEFMLGNITDFSVIQQPEINTTTSKLHLLDTNASCNEKSVENQTTIQQKKLHHVTLDNTAELRQCKNNVSFMTVAEKDVASKSLEKIECLNVEEDKSENTEATLTVRNQQKDIVEESADLNTQNGDNEESDDDVSLALIAQQKLKENKYIDAKNPPENESNLAKTKRSKKKKNKHVIDNDALKSDSPEQDFGSDQKVKSSQTKENKIKPKTVKFKTSKRSKKRLKKTKLTKLFVKNTQTTNLKIILGSHKSDDEKKSLVKHKAKADEINQTQTIQEPNVIDNQVLDEVSTKMSDILCCGQSSKQENNITNADSVKNSKTKHGKLHDSALKEQLSIDSTSLSMKISFNNLEQPQDFCEINTPKASVNKMEITTPLRRSLRGKSIFVERLEDEMVSFETTDVKAPLTKKQLIFSKLLCDEEKFKLSNEKNLAGDNQTPPLFQHEGVTYNDHVDNQVNNIVEIESSTERETTAENEINIEKEITVGQEIASERESTVKKESKTRRKSFKRKKTSSREKQKKSRSNEHTELVPAEKHINKNSSNFSMDDCKSKSNSVNEETIKDNVSEFLNPISNVDLEKEIVVSTSEKGKDIKLPYELTPKSKAKKVKVLECLHDDKISNRNHGSEETIKDGISSVAICEPSTNAEIKEFETITPSHILNQDVASKSKYKKIKISEPTVNESLVLVDQNKSIPSSETKITTCYSKPLASRRIRSKSVGGKQLNTVEVYDPYDIDLDEMIENKNVDKKITNLERKRAKSKSTSNKGNKNVHLEKNINKTDFQPFEVNDSDSSKSDVPLNNYARAKESKKRSNAKEEAKIVQNVVPEKTENEREETVKNSDDNNLRSDILYDNFGIINERKPRRSNLIASRKISETFQVMDNEFDDDFSERTKRRNTKNLQINNKEPLNVELVENKPSTSKIMSLKQKETEEINYDSFCRNENIQTQLMTLQNTSQFSKTELNQITKIVKKHINKLKVKLEKQKNDPNETNARLPTMKDIYIMLQNIVRKPQLAKRLTKDEALFLDCCELLQENPRNDWQCSDINNAVITTNINVDVAQSYADNNIPKSSTQQCIPLSSTQECVSLSLSQQNIHAGACLRQPSMEEYIPEVYTGRTAVQPLIINEGNHGYHSYGDVDDITARNILESEEVRLLENDLITGFKQAAIAKQAAISQQHVEDLRHETLPSTIIMNDRSSSICEQKGDQGDIAAPRETLSEKLNSFPDIEGERYPDRFGAISLKEVNQIDIAEPEDVLPKIYPEIKETMYPERISSISEQEADQKHKAASEETPSEKLYTITEIKGKRYPDRYSTVSLEAHHITTPTLEKIVSKNMKKYPDIKENMCSDRSSSISEQEANQLHVAAPEKTVSEKLNTFPEIKGKRYPDRFSVITLEGSHQIDMAEPEEIKAKKQKKYPEIRGMIFSERSSTISEQETDQIHIGTPGGILSEKLNMFTEIKGKRHPDKYCTISSEDAHQINTPEPVDNKSKEMKKYPEIKEKINADKSRSTFGQEADQLNTPSPVENVSKKMKKYPEIKEKIYSNRFRSISGQETDQIDIPALDETVLKKVKKYPEIKENTYPDRSMSTFGHETDQIDTSAPVDIISKNIKKYPEIKEKINADRSRSSFGQETDQICTPAPVDTVPKKMKKYPEIKEKINADRSRSTIGQETDQICTPAPVDTVPKKMKKYPEVKEKINADRSRSTIGQETDQICTPAPVDTVPKKMKKYPEVKEKINADRSRSTIGQETDQICTPAPVDTVPKKMQKYPEVKDKINADRSRSTFGQEADQIDIPAPLDNVSKRTKKYPEIKEKIYPDRSRSVAEQEADQIEKPAPVDNLAKKMKKYPEIKEKHKTDRSWSTSGQEADQTDIPLLKETVSKKMKKYREIKEKNKADRSWSTSGQEADQTDIPLLKETVSKKMKKYPEIKEKNKADRSWSTSGQEADQTDIPVLKETVSKKMKNNPEIKEKTYPDSSKTAFGQETDQIAPAPVDNFAKKMKKYPEIKEKINADRSWSTSGKEADQIDMPVLKETVSKKIKKYPEIKEKIYPAKSSSISRQETDQIDTPAPEETVAKKLKKCPEIKEKTYPEIKEKMYPEIKEKMYPDILIEDIDMYEDKFDKIKRKCRSQAAAAKQAQSLLESTSNSQKIRKRSEKKKIKKSKKNQANTVLTKGALKGFDGIKGTSATADTTLSNVRDSSAKKKKKFSSKKKRDVRSSAGSSSKHDGERRGKDSSKKLLDVYEFMDNEDVELFEFRPSTLMERFKSMNNKDNAHTSRSKANSNNKDNSSESGSDGDDFVYMSDDYVCSDDETENSIMSCEIQNTKVSSDFKKVASPPKRKEYVDKSAAIGKIIKSSVAHNDKKLPKPKDSAKPKANLDQLFDSLLQNEETCTDADKEPSINNSQLSSTPPAENATVKKFATIATQYEPLLIETENRLSPSKDNFTVMKLITSPRERSSTSGKKQPSISPRMRAASPKKITSPARTMSPIDESPIGNEYYENSVEVDSIIEKNVTKKYDQSLQLSDDDSYQSHDISRRAFREFSTRHDDFDRKKHSSKSKTSKCRRRSSRDRVSISSEEDIFDETCRDYDAAGVARHRARRKCTVGKQNVLAETWSSESEGDSGRARIRARVRRREPAMPRRRPAPVPVQARAPSPAACSYWTEETEEPEHVQQHGWIVGDSHKKLVTLLAHAKGRKRHYDDRRFLD